MRLALVVVGLSLATGQSPQQFSGTWIAEHEGTAFIRIEVRSNSATLDGKIALGNVELDSTGAVRTAAPAPELSAITDIVTQDRTMTFTHRDGEDTDKFELRLTDTGAELSFILSDAMRKELAEANIPTPKPVRLRRALP